MPQTMVSASDENNGQLSMAYDATGNTIVNNSASSLWLGGHAKQNVISGNDIEFNLDVSSEADRNVIINNQATDIYVGGGDGNTLQARAVPAAAHGLRSGFFCIRFACASTRCVRHAVRPPLCPSCGGVMRSARTR
jgi:hypothetical protein